MMSNIVNKAIKTIFYLFLFLFKKNFVAWKNRKTSKKQLTKQKQVDIKEQKQQFFRAQEYS